MRKKILVIAVTAIFLLVGVKMASALVPLVPLPHIDPAVVKAWHDARCAKFKDKIAEKTSNMGDRYDKHLNAYNNLASRLDNLISRLQDNGYNVSQLKTDLSNLNSKIDKFKEDYNSLTDAADAAKGNVCSDTDAKIKTNLGGIRTFVQAVKKDAKDIRTYYKNDIREDILAVKNQKI